MCCDTKSSEVTQDHGQRSKVTIGVHPSAGHYDKSVYKTAREYIFRDYDYIPPGSFAVIPWYYMGILFMVHTFMALFGPAVLWFGLWETYIFLAVYSTFGGLGVTAGAHRLWSHRSYKAKWPLRLLLAFQQTVTGFDTIYNWSVIHRVHHRYSDTDADPHNVKRGNN